MGDQKVAIGIGLAAALVVGGAVGYAAGGSQDGNTPAEVSVTLAEYQELSQRLIASEDKVDSLRSENASMQNTIDSYRIEEDQPGQLVTVPPGWWVVGEELPAGTYKLSEPAVGRCTWSIMRSGTNGEDLLVYESIEGGQPRVTLKKGQDFESDCGEWVLVEG